MPPITFMFSFAAHSMRLGPSASAAALELSAEKCDQLLACLSTMQQLVQDPSIREAMQGLASQFPGLLSPGGEPTEKDAAEKGEPAGSKPLGGAGVKPAALPITIPKSEPARETEPGVKEEPKVDTSAATTEKDVKGEEASENEAEDGDCPEYPPPTALVNSSTHRKEHARLGRRMAHIDPAKFPEMARLWNGNRQDRGLKSTSCL